MTDHQRRTRVTADERRPASLRTSLVLALVAALIVGPLVPTVVAGAHGSIEAPPDRVEHTVVETHTELNSDRLRALDSEGVSVGRLDVEADNSDVESVGEHRFASGELAEGSFRRILGPGLVLGLAYSRYDDSNPLDNEVRAEAFETIKNSPGVHLSALSRRTDTPRSTVRYHVRILEEEGMVSGTKIRGKYRLYTVDTERGELSAALADESTAAVLNAVARLEPVTVSRLAAELDRAPSTISYHLTQLAELDLIERERDGNAVLSRVTPDVRSSLSADVTRPDTADSGVET